MATAAKAPTVADIVSGVQNFISSSIQATKEKQTNLQRMGEIAQETAKTYEIVAQDLAVVKATEQAAELKVQKEKAAVAAAAGVNLDGGTNELVTLMQKQLSANKETEAAMIEYNKKNETTIFDGPIDYLIAQVTLPIAEAKLESAASRAKLYSEQLVGINNSLQESFQTLEARKESVTAASAAAASRAAAAGAVINAQQAEIDAIKYNNLGLEAVQSATADQIQMMTVGNNAVKQEQELRLRQAAEARAAESFNWAKEQQEVERAARASAASSSAIFLSRVNAAEDAAGLPRTSEQELQLVLKAGGSQEIQDLYQRGKRIQANGGRPVLGTSPADVAKFLEASGTQGLPKVVQDTAEILERAKQMVATNPKLAGSKNKAEIEAGFNSYVDLIVKDQYAAIDNSPNNLFNVGDIKQYLQDPALAQLPVVKKFLLPAATSGVSLDSPKNVMDLAHAAMKSGQLTSSEIAGLATVYAKANLTNQQLRRFGDLGIIPPEAGMKYRVKVGWAGRTIDMTDPVSIQTYISRKAAMEMAPTIFSVPDPKVPLR